MLRILGIIIILSILFGRRSVRNGFRSGLHALVSLGIGYVLLRVLVGGVVVFMLLRLLNIVRFLFFMF